MFLECHFKNTLNKTKKNVKGEIDEEKNKVGKKGLLNFDDLIFK